MPNLGFKNAKECGDGLKSPTHFQFQPDTKLHFFSTFMAIFFAFHGGFQISNLPRGQVVGANFSFSGAASFFAVLQLVSEADMILLARLLNRNFDICWKQAPKLLK